MLCNIKIHPFDIRDIKPRVLVPMHLFKFMHNREELKSSTFIDAIERYDQYAQDLSGVDIKLLFPGESFEYSHLD